MQSSYWLFNTKILSRSLRYRIGAVLFLLFLPIAAVQGSILFAQNTPSIVVGCSSSDLLQAIATANANQETTTIHLAAGCTYTLSTHNNADTTGASDDGGKNGLPSIQSSLVIVGNGATIERDTTVGTAAFRFFRVAVGGSLSLYNLTLRNGAVQPANTNGGALHNRGTLTLDHVTLVNNVAEQGAGGALYSATDSTTSIQYSTIGTEAAPDRAHLEGGGIANHGTMVIAHSTVQYNQCSTSGTTELAQRGGGIANHGTMQIQHTTVHHNISGNAEASIWLGSLLPQGGGIYNANHATLTISSSTISANSARDWYTIAGGGIYNASNASLVINNSTLSGNTTNSLFLGGGAIYNGSDAHIALHSSTVAYNTAWMHGGGIYNGSGQAHVENSIIAHNNLFSRNAEVDVYGDFDSGGYNLIGVGNGASGLSHEGDRVGNATAPVDALLEPLADNGGETSTHALQTDSPAINAGNPSGCLDATGTEITTDQRGEQRISSCDIGAFESLLLVDPIIVDQVVGVTPSNPAPYDNFGSAVAVSQETVVVGAEGHHVGDKYNVGTGYVFGYDTSLSAWVQQAQVGFSPGEEQANAYFGKSVAVLAERAAVGSILYDGAGSTFLFERDEGGTAAWGRTGHVIPTQGFYGFDFGSSIALSGDMLAVGAPGNTQGGMTCGAVYLFAQEGVSWQKITQVFPTDCQNDGKFGRAVALSEDILVVGAGGGTQLEPQVGAAYVFERQADHSWIQVAKLQPSDGEPGDAFGFSVAVYEQTIVVGAYADSDDDTHMHGAAYVFERTGDETAPWEEVVKLLPADETADAYFGWSGAIHDDLVVIGSHRAVVGAVPCGAAYVFERNRGGTNAWGQALKLANPTCNDGDYFGRNVAVDSDAVIVSAERKDEHGTNTGGAYIYPRVKPGAKPLVFHSKKMAYQDRPLPFTAAEFGRNFNDPLTGAPLAQVEIQVVPAHGTLSVQGTTLSAGALLTTSELDALVYTPHTGYLGGDSFVWTGRSASNAATNSALVTITIVPNHIPSVAAIYRSGTANSTTTLIPAHFRHAFSDEDPEQDLATIKIVSLPAQGTLTVNGKTLAQGDEVLVAEMNQVVFTPPPSWTGTTTFAWNGSDGFDYAPTDALVSLTIFPPTNRTNHAGVVIEQPDGSYTTYCINLDDIHLQNPTEEWKNGIRLLQATGQYIGLQALSYTNVCRIGGRGCSGDDCWCHDPYLWRDWLLDDYDMWHEPLFYETAFERAVQPGDVEWWRWSNSYAVEPPIIFFEQICPNDNIPPLVSTVTRYTTVDTSVHFSQQDFVAAFDDQDGDSLSSVIITALPENATLTLSGTVVVTGSEIAADMLDTLTLTPTSGWHGTIFFGWNGSDGHAYATREAIVSVVVRLPNAPPDVSDFQEQGTQDTSLSLGQEDFSTHFFDPGGSPIQQVMIISLPLSGTLSHNGNVLTTDDMPYEMDAGTMGTILFTPNTGWYGTTSFAWSGSNGTTYASSALVVLKIVRVSTYTNHNGLVLDYGGGRVETFCIDRAVADALPAAGGAGDGDGSVTGKEITLASGRSTVQGFSGGTVCKLHDTGCADSDDCWCSCRTLGDNCIYWSYWHLNAEGTAWNYSELGWSYYLVRNPGTVEGWLWGNGGFGGGATPQVKTFAELCASVPVVSDVSASTTENTPLTFSPDVFVGGFGDADGNSLATVKVHSLPEHGTLTVQGKAVSPNQIITFANLNQMVFTPAAGWLGTTHFTWSGSDGANFADEPATITILVAPAIGNTPPTVSDIPVYGLANMPIAFGQDDFSQAFHDSDEGDTLQTVKITRAPQRGTLFLGTTVVAAGRELSISELDTLTYRPLTNLTGSDSFGWNGSDGTTYAPQQARVLVTVYDAGPSLEERTTASEEAAYWLGTMQQDDGGYGSPGLTIDTIFSVVAAQGDVATWRNAQCQSMLDSLKTEARSYAETNAASAGKLILGLVAAGVQDVSDFGGVDLLTILQDYYDPTTGSFGTRLSDGSLSSSNWDQAFAILALRAINQPVPDAAIDQMINRAQTDGSWCFYPPGQWKFSCVDTTGLVLQALAAANVSSQSDAITMALDYLHTAQNDDGGFPDLPAGWTGTAESNANSTALAVNGLLAVGEDPLGLAWTRWTPEPVNPISFLLTLQQDDGSLSWKAEQAGDTLIATHQSIPAILGKPFPITPATTSTAISYDQCPSGATPTPTPTTLTPTTEATPGGAGTPTPTTVVPTTPTPGIPSHTSCAPQDGEYLFTVTPAQGGHLALNTIQFFVPSGAVSETIHIVYTPLVTPSFALTHPMVALQSFRLRAYVNDDTCLENNAFIAPFTLVLPYTDTQGETRRVLEDTLAIAFWDDTENIWQTNSDTIIYPQENEVHADLDRLAEFVLMARTGSNQDDTDDMLVYLPLILKSYR